MRSYLASEASSSDASEATQTARWSRSWCDRASTRRTRCSDRSAPRCFDGSRSACSAAASASGSGRAAGPRQRSCPGRSLRTADGPGSASPRPGRRKPNNHEEMPRPPPDCRPPPPSGTSAGRGSGGSPAGRPSELPKRASPSTSTSVSSPPRSDWSLARTRSRKVRSSRERGSVLVGTSPGSSVVAYRLSNACCFFGCE
jgi:hypothetical protein